MVQDWAGGTRIGHALSEFNRVWSRRVLGQGAVVLLISDGLDRDAGQGLAVEMERLHKSCRRLIWLNPLLRYDQYAPISAGARAMIRHVDDLRTVHNLESLRELTEVLSREPRRRAEGASEWVTARRSPAALILLPYTLTYRFSAPRDRAHAERHHHARAAEDVGRCDQVLCRMQRRSRAGTIPLPCSCPCTVPRLSSWPMCWPASTPRRRRARQSRTR